MVHGVSKTHPLSEGLASVRSFLTSTQEIVLWNGGYYGFGLNDGGQMPPEAHQELQVLLEEAFGPWWAKPSGGWDATLEELWTQEGLAPGQGRILLHYGNSDNFDPSLDFPSRPNYFGNILFPEDLKPHLDDSIADAEANGYPRYRLSCQMTPRQVYDVTVRYPDGLRQMAELVDRNVTRWFVEDYADLTHVHTGHDYVLATDMVRISIDRNLRMRARL